MEVTAQMHPTGRLTERATAVCVLFVRRVEAGDMDKAREAVSTLRKLNPNFTLSTAPQ